MNPVRIAFKAAFLFVLLALAGQGWAKPWKSAEMITQQNFKYGAFEARIRGAEGSGFITAFFLYKNGSELPGALWQEQDFELFGKNGDFQTQLMTPGDPRVEHAVVHTGKTPIWQRYYTYRMEWTPTALSFYMDGKLIRKETDAVTYAKLLDPARAEPMNLRLSLWAGDFPWSGAFDPTKVPNGIDVNWAQVSSYTPGKGLAGSDFTPLWKDDFNTIDNSRWYFANWTFDYAVNDYTSGAARTNNGYLQLKLTQWSDVGQQFTPSPVDDGLLQPPDGGIDFGDSSTVVGEPVVLPATLAAVNPSRFYDLTAGNAGAASCFNGNLDAEPSIEGGCNVGWSLPGEWQEYRVQVPQDGEYDLGLRVATGINGVYFRLDIDGIAGSEEYDVLPYGWQALHDLATKRIFLTAGVHRVRVVHLTEGLNVHSLTFAATSVLSPPAVVQNLTALGGVLKVSLSWSPADRATNYEIRRGPVGGTQVAVGTTTNTQWTDLNVLGGSSYGYSVVSVNAAGSALPSTPVSATVQSPTPADKPSALSAVASDGRVSLTWVGGLNNTSFAVYRSTDGINFTLVRSPLVASWLDVGLTNGTAYSYRVAGVFEGRESAPTATVLATPRGVPPQPVSAVSALAGDAQVQLTWPPALGATSYTVFRSLVGGTAVPVATVTGTSWINLGLTNNTTYTWSILASNVWGNAASKPSVTATPKAITSSIKAQYRAGTLGNTNGLRPLLKLLNSGSAAVPLSELSLRYWYTNEGGRPQTYWCDWAQVGCANLVGSFGAVTPARVGADTYLQVGFRPTAGSIAAGGTTGEIQNRITKSDWSDFIQTNDASYNGLGGTAFADWSRVTVYRNGVLIWGMEP